MTPETRSRIYILATVVAVLGLLAAGIFGAIDLATAKETILWVVGVFGGGAAITATANRPTKLP